MKKITERVNARVRSRRSDIQAWGDARALPFTEGQAVVAAGRIGPAYIPAMRENAA